MSDENKQQNEQTPSDNPQPEKPKIFALKRQGGGWTMNRKSFIEAASAVVGAVALGGCAAPRSTPTNKRNSPRASRAGLSIYAHEKGVKSLAISPDGKRLASGGEEGKLKLWVLPTGAFEKSIAAAGSSLDSLVFGSDGHFLISGASGNSNENIKLWKFPDLNQEKGFGGGQWGSLPIHLAISPDGSSLASGGRDKQVRLWSLPEGGLMKASEAEQDATSLRVLFSADGKKLLTLNGSEQISLRSIPELASEGKLPTSNAYGSGSGFVCFAITPDGQTLIAGRKNGVIELISFVTGQLFASLKGHTQGINALAVTPDGKLLASGSNDTNIKLWSLPEGALLKTLTGHSNKVNALAVAPDGKLLVSGSDDKTIRLWSLPDGKEVSHLIDLDVNYKTTEGIKYKSVNEYGQTITYTLPCGSPIPSGAVCVCNCVPGTLTIPMGYTQRFSGGGVCSCDTICTCVPVCTCQSVGTPGGYGGYGGHYWYPN